jgi:DNA polymerase III epsilon subunit-like protein
MARMLVFDTETGGIDPMANSILSLGAVVWDDGVLGAEFEVKIKEPVLSLTIEAMAINKIDLVEHAKTALAPAEAMKKFRAFLKKHFKGDLASKVPLVGHNVGFDIGFLKRLCKLSDENYEELFSHRSTDTAGILRFMALAGRSKLSGAGLDQALAHFNIEVNGGLRHTALEDARATAVLLTKLVELAGPAPAPKPLRAKPSRKAAKANGSGAANKRNGSSRVHATETRP